MLERWHLLYLFNLMQMYRIFFQRHNINSCLELNLPFWCFLRKREEIIFFLHMRKKIKRDNQLNIFHSIEEVITS